VRIPFRGRCGRAVCHPLAGGDFFEGGIPGAEDLLGKLYELAQTVGNDSESFKALVEPA